MEFIQEYWEQLAIVGFAILAIVKMKCEVDSLKKDVSDLYKRNTFIEVVTLKAEMEVVKRNITSLWDKFNSLVKKE